MNKLIILSAFFLTSCANNQHKRHSLATVKYTVREYYLPVEIKPEVKTDSKPTKSVKKLSKSVKKKTNRLDCGRVFKEINQCMKQ